MKNVVMCSKCANAALKLHTGFIGTNELYCTKHSGTVDEDDGCTFGIPGAPQTAVSDYEVDINERAAVNGCSW